MSVERKRNLKGGIRRRITWILFIYGSLATLIAGGFFYNFVYHMRLDTLKEHQSASARILSESTAMLLDRAVTALESYVSSPAWKEAVMASNSRFDGMAESEVMNYMLEADKKWMQASADMPPVSGYLLSPLGARLLNLAAADKSIAEILLTDRYGGLVASSAKTTDFYQADEEWWQKAYAGGKGSVYIGEVALDKSSGVYCVTIAVPLFDDGLRLVGICKESVDAEQFFSSIGSHTIGKTEHATLVDDRGRVIYEKGVQPFTTRECSNKDMSRLETAKSIIMAGRCRRNGPGCKSLYSLARVQGGAFANNGIGWNAVIAQCTDEVFLPLEAIAKKMAFIAGGIIIILVVCGFIIGGIFAAPLHELYVATEKIISGTSERVPLIRSGDEVEQLSVVFGKMVEQDKAKQTELEEVKKRLVKFGAGLENTVAERTLDLRRSQEATMNILEDLLEAKIELEAREERYRTLFEAAGDPIIVHDMDGRILAVNEMAVRQYGYSEPEMLAMTVDVVGTPEHALLAPERIGRIMAEFALKFETVHQHKDGSRVAVEVNARRITWGDGPAVMSICRNISDRKAIEKEQRLAQLGRLVAEMAHEVNNPLMIISGNAQVALLDLPRDSALRESLTIMIEECKRAKGIISRVLSFARPSAGNRASTDMNDVIESVVSLVEKQYLLSNVAIRRKYAGGLPRVVADQRQMQEVFMNLFSNAREAMPSGGVIDVTTTFAGGIVRAMVKDSGGGITEESKKRLFEPFFTTKETGTGLGLAICHGIVKSHGGDMLVESEAGRGTLFTVILPAEGERHA